MLQIATLLLSIYSLSIPQIRHWKHWRRLMLFRQSLRRCIVRVSLYSARSRRSCWARAQNASIHVCKVDTPVDLHLEQTYSASNDICFVAWTPRYVLRFHLVHSADIAWDHVEFVPMPRVRSHAYDHDETLIGSGYNSAPEIKVLIS
jgi:hypothetical protein